MLVYFWEEGRREGRGVEEDRGGGSLGREEGEESGGFF